MLPSLYIVSYIEMAGTLTFKLNGNRPRHRLANFMHPRAHHYSAKGVEKSKETAECHRHINTDLLLQLSVSDGSFRRRDRTVVNKGGTLTVPVGHMTIDRVVTGVGLSADKPVPTERNERRKINKQIKWPALATWKWASESRSSV